MKNYTVWAGSISVKIEMIRISKTLLLVKVDVDKYFLYPLGVY